MSQANQTSITNFFGIRTQKRKYAPQDGPVHKKLAASTASTDEAFDAPKTIPAVRLTFECDGSEPARRPTKAPKVEAPETPETPQTSRTPQMSIDKVREALLGSDRLGELKARMANFNRNYENLKRTPVKAEAEEEASLREFGSIEVLVPTSPRKPTPTKPGVSPSKAVRANLFGSPSKATPAHLRFATLAEPTPALGLPHHYRWLAEAFRAIETVSSMLHNRGEKIAFSRVRPAAQEMLKRNVTEKQLSQIKRIRPEMYAFAREKTKEGPELTLTPNLAGGTFAPDDILRRRRDFYEALVEKAKDHHEAFLLSLDPPLSIPREKLARWHPEFDLERIPDVEEDPLPPIPEADRLSSAQEMLSRMSDTPNRRMQAAAQRIAADREAPPNEIPDAPRFINPALRNINASLLQRVKAFQAEKALKAMTTSRSEDEAAHQRLPYLARTLRNTFLAEKKGILAVEVLIPKLGNSFGGKVSNADLHTDLKLLAKEAPEWVTFQTLRKMEYLKIQKCTDFTKIINKLESLAKSHD